MTRLPPWVPDWSRIRPGRTGNGTRNGEGRKETMSRTEKRK